MRIQELVTRADTIDHLVARAAKVASFIESIASHPLLFREFRTGINYETLIAKVENDTPEGPRSPKYVKKGSNGKQAAVLEALNIQNPVFCKMGVSGSTYGFHGDLHIFVPPPGARIVWSPVVVDLGGNDIDGPDKGNYGSIRDPINPNTSTSGGPERQIGAEFASTYKEGWPNGFTKNELICDCPHYYLVNVKSFISKFIGVKNRNIMPDRAPMFKNLDAELFNAKFKTYGDVAWYLTNTVPSYLKWYKEKYPMAK